MLSPSYVLALASLINQWYLSFSDLDIQETTVLSYLSRCNFMSIIWKEDKSIHTGNSDNLYEIQLIWKEPNYSEISVFVQKMLQKMISAKSNEKFHDTIEKTVMFAMTELVSNVSTHSQSDFDKKWCMYMVQYYPATASLHVAIVDSGHWITRTLANSIHYKEWASSDYYMDLAMKQYHSRDPWTRSIWRWNWLFICNTIIESTYSTMQIMSRSDRHENHGWNRAVRIESWQFPGTLINLEFEMRWVESCDIGSLYKLIWTTPTDIEDMQVYQDLFN